MRRQSMDTTVIGNNTVTIKGDITCTSATSIGATVQGNVLSEVDVPITIEGKVIGNVSVRGKLILTSTADIKGDIDCKVMFADDGCIINGTVHILGEGGVSA